MPLGRIYQAPTTVARNTPVFGYNGLKSVSNSDLVITGQAVRNKKSKSPSPSAKPPPAKASSSSSSASPKLPSISPPRQGGSRKSPSPGLRPARPPGQTPKARLKVVAAARDNRTNKENNTNKNLNDNSTSNGSDLCDTCHKTHCEHDDVSSELDNATRAKSWSPEAEVDKKIANDNDSVTEDTKHEDERLHNGNGNSARHSQTNGSRASESPARETTGGASGLRNIGNTCFMNSVLQCLSNTKQLTNYLLADDHLREINTSNSSMKGSLIKAFATVIKGLWKGSGRVVDPSSLKGAVNRFAPRFSGYNQEDSQEFLRYLLEGLHEDVNRVLTKPTPINSEIDSSLSVCEQAMEAWKRYIRRDDSQLVDLFVGQLKSTLRCSECAHESVTFEPFWDLSLGIPARTGEVSLTDCLDSFTKEEIMDGDEMPTCERCKARRRCTKHYSLYRLPKILVVHLKRFSQSDRFKQKLSSTVTFPINGLNLSKYTDSVTSASYNCYAVSNHSGTLYSGHYTAYAKHPQSGQWHSYNDSRVTKCSSSNVISNEAYLLFFELSS